MKTVMSAEVEHIVPFHTVSLPFELTPGRYVIVNWKPTDNESTSFNFGQGFDFTSTVVFHFNPRLGSNVVVRNTKDGSWGSEERDGTMPFKIGATSQIKLVVTAAGYECFVDGVKHCTYANRVDANTAKFFFISGTGEVHNITFGDEAADQAASECKGITLPHTKSCTVYPGYKIYYSGIPTTKNTRIRVIFKVNEDYALCFAVRMDDELVIMNSKVGNGWGSEERNNNFPFKVDQFFNICIEVATDKFKVCVNDQPYAEFTHRLLPITNINTIQFDGEAKVCALCEHVN